MISPRYYQVAALEAVIRELLIRVSTLVDMATGTGKTFLFAWLCRILGGRVLVLVHREELLKQAVDKINRVAPDLGVTIERRKAQGDRRRERNLFDSEPTRVVVASKDTLCRKGRLKRYRPDDFDYIIIDEAHRAVKKNESYHAILKYFCRAPIGTGSARLIGVSASLDRNDKEALGGLFQSVAYRYTLAQAIEDGFLLEPRVKKVHINGLRLLSLPTSRTPDGKREVTQAALDRAMHRREYVLGIAAPLLDLANEGGRKRSGVVFCSSGPQAKLQAEVLNSMSPGCAAICLGEPHQNDDERSAVQVMFRKRRVQFLCTCDVLTEGWDSDICEIVVLKPTGSRARAAQMAGRGTRPLDGCVDVWDTPEMRKLAIAASPKPWLILLDPRGVSDQHSLVNVADIFTGRYSPETTSAPAPRKPTERPDDMDERRAARNAMEAIEAEKLAGLRVAVDYELTDGDMLSTSPTVKVEPCPRGMIDHPATEAQCRWLENHGLRASPSLTKRQAQDIINAEKAREGAAPATAAQCKILARYGLPVNVTKAEAKSQIDAIASNDWKLPEPERAETSKDD